MRQLALLLLLSGFVCAQEKEGAPGEEEARSGGLDALGGGLDWKAKPIDFKKVDRTIRKLPDLKSAKPLYGLFLFGVDGRTRVWAVLDKSAKDKTEYDILYLDRNADGDLTGKDERFESRSAEMRTFVIGDFKEPGTDVIHTDFEIGWIAGSFSYRMKWAGGPKTMGPQGRTGDEFARLAPSPKEAPIFVPGTDRPFEFEQWRSGTLKRGQVNDFKVFIGNRGDRTGAFSCVDETFLPEGESVLVQLVCKDATGKERKLTAELKDRARGVGCYHGPVRVPKDARPGPAIVRVRLPESSKYESFTTEIPVTIE
jgi:hypothetical protein